MLTLPQQRNIVRVEQALKGEMPGQVGQLDGPTLHIRC